MRLKKNKKNNNNNNDNNNNNNINNNNDNSGGGDYSLQALQDQTIEIEMTLAFYQKRQQLIITLILSLKSMIYSKSLIFKILMLILYFNRDLIT